MDISCAFLEKLLVWVNRQALPRIVYVGQGSLGFANAPAPYLEICYVQQGDVGRLRLGEMTVAPPDTFVCLQSVHHGVYSQRYVSIKAWCAFIDVADAEEFADLYDRPIFHGLAAANPAALVRAFQRLTLRCRRAGWGYTFYPPPRRQEPSPSLSPADGYAIRSALTELLVGLLEDRREQLAPPAHRLPAAVRDTLDYLDTHYADADLTAAALARRVRLTPTHFTRLFGRHVGQPPMTYLRRLRIGTAVQLLRQTDQPVQTVAWSVGFSDPFHFSRVFKQIVGASPRQVRLADAAQGPSL
ncbi:MAG: helix-turn-helix transcriptional regulator [Planctomycetes bacterium]|mgnify:CR=1 FL=1|nr:helix-turn-helix transcriptional regulator [Planctomycetota bacterium]